MSEKPVKFIVNGVAVNHDGVPIDELNKPTADQARIKELEAQLSAEQKRVAELEQLVKEQLADDKASKARK
jgi:hypothetical protein